MLLLAVALGYQGTVPFTAFRDSFQVLLAAFPVILLGRLYGKTRLPTTLAILAAAAVWFGVSAAELVVSVEWGTERDLAAWAAGLLGMSTGYLVFVEGYPERGGLSGRGGPAGERDRLLASMYSRMLETHSALVQQDRLVASGLLALGAAHEFKNTLAHVKAAAEHALAQPAPERAQEGLRLIAELAESGGRSAVEFLERLSQEGREEPRETELDELTGRFLRLLRPACRPEGIALRSELEPNLRSLVRRGEVEQILFNLARNALEGFRRSSPDGERIISVILRGSEETAVIDVIDNAGGVTAEALARLFQVNPGPGRTGVGLYISASLAERNGGTLTYEPRERGSCFRLTLPLTSSAAGEQPMRGQ